MHSILSALRGPALPRLLGLLAALCLAAPAVRAQDCQFPRDGEHVTGDICYTPPMINPTPLNAHVTQPVVPVSIVASDYYVDGGDPYSFRIEVDNQDVTSQWGVTQTTSGSVSGRKFTLRASGTVQLSLTNTQRTLKVTLCDTATPCASRSAVYTLALSGVRVTPDADTVTVAPGAASRSFVVHNTGTDTATFRLVAECRNAATGDALAGCSPSLPQVTLQAGQTASIPVSFTAGAETSLTVGLRAVRTPAAGVEDAGWADVTVGTTGSYYFAPQVSLVDLNSGVQVERGQCVTVSAGSGAAYECGDLRLVHALPTTVTRGKARTPVLLYNSAHASPRPLLYADVMLASLAIRPDSVEAVVVMSGGGTARAVWPGSQWAAGTTRRVAVALDDLGATGVYGYTLQVTNWYGGTPYRATGIVGELTFVSRRDSPFGAGWSLAGLERLIQLPDGARTLLVAGDGSARVYRWVATNTSVADPVVDRPDTLRYGNVNGQLWAYRRLPGGSVVWFAPDGRHAHTINRLGDTTRFTYSGEKLRYISVPRRDGQATANYSFNYDAQGRLASITAPPNGNQNRPVTLEYALGDRRVTGIRDPDSRWVRFGYDGAPRPAMVTSRTDRRLTQVRYAYDAAGKLASVKLPLAPNDTITSRFEALEGKGLTASVPLAQAYTALDGPRTDVTDRTYLWLTRWGAPRRIRNAAGAETVVYRDDPRFPALPTKTVAPGGLTSTAVYDTAGRVSSTTLVNPLGDQRNVLTTYTYDHRWAAVTGISTYAVESNGATTPLAGSTALSYDAATGNLEWQQQGDSRADFRYYGSGPAVGQLRAVATRLNSGETAVDSVVYDAVGNVSMTVNPLQFLTLHYRDAIGRDTLVVTPTTTAGATSVAGLLATGVRRYSNYSVMDRVRRATTTGPAMTHASNPDATFTPPPTAQEQLTVETWYNAEGMVDSVTRRVSPDPNELYDQSTLYTYDAAGRRSTETMRGSSGPLITRQFGYDHAGNLVATTTPRGLTATATYDVLGRLQRRVTPAVVYAAAGCPIGCMHPRFPIHPNAGTGYRIEEEWTNYVYDLTGNVLYAENADAIIARRYYPGGALKTDSLRIRTADGGDFTTQQYGLAYSYDLAGRVTGVQHPENLAGSSSVDQYGYHPVTGALSAAQDRFGNPFGFGYDAAGRMTSVRMPPGGSPVVDSLAYDVAGRLVWRRETSPAGMLQDERLAYDARGKLVRTEVLQGGGSTYTQWYSGLGNLVATDWTNMVGLAWAREEFVVDPLGNMARKRTHVPGAESPNNDFPDYQYRYDGLARVWQVAKVDITTYPALDDFTERFYDMAGNLLRGTQDVEGVYSNGVPGVVRDIDDASYYDADDRLRVFQQYDIDVEPGNGQGVWEEYRYDPLGRRVLVRTRRESPYCNLGGTDCLSSVTQFVWSGDQILWELKDVPGSYGDEAGGRVSYFHAGGIDRPLAIWKQEVGTVVTHQNWRGQFALGTHTNGASSDCAVYPPQGCVPVRWPGWATTAWHQEVQNAPVTGYEHYWFGSLAVGMRDASGQMYMRNRYYDPQTGQFTQPDPIGLAGGLNAYGFAAGDPVSYSDPYGLCADHQFKKHGFLGGLGIGRTTCPGGLSRPEYRRIEGMIRNNFDAEAGGRLQGMLESGNVRRVRRTAHDREAEAFGGDEVRVADKFFATKEDGDAAWILGHEMGHNVQWELGMLISEMGDANVQPDAGRLIGLMRTEGLENDSAFSTYQNDANMYACAHVTGMVERAGHCNK